MELVWTLGLALALALGPAPAGGHPQPCGVLARLGGSVRVGALLPRAPTARARARAALTRAVLAARLPHNLSLELVAAAPPARDPASLARGVCQALSAPGVAALLAFPEARPELLQLHFLATATGTPVLSVLRREARAPLGAPTPFHLQLDWGCPLDTLLEVLVSVLRAHSWEDVGLVLCRARDPAGLLALWTRWAGRAPRLVLNLGRPDTGAAGLRARLAPLGAPVGAEGPVPVAVLLGCDAPRARRVLEAAPPGPRWLLGTPLAAEALPTAGLPPGLLALGEVARPPLEAAIHDAVELVARALGSAVLVRPEPALHPAKLSCEDLQAAGSDSWGRFLARVLANTSFQGHTGPVWVTSTSRVHLSRRFKVWSLRSDPLGAPAWATLGSWRDGRLELEPGPAQAARGDAGGAPLRVRPGAGRGRAVPGGAAVPGPPHQRLGRPGRAVRRAGQRLGAAEPAQVLLRLLHRPPGAAGRGRALLLRAVHRGGRQVRRPAGRPLDRPGGRPAGRQGPHGRHQLQHQLGPLPGGGLHQPLLLHQPGHPGAGPRRRLAHRRLHVAAALVHVAGRVRRAAPHRALPHAVRMAQPLRPHAPRPQQDHRVLLLLRPQPLLRHPVRPHGVQQDAQVSHRPLSHEPLGHLLPARAVQLHGQPGRRHGGGQDLRGAVGHPRPQAAPPGPGLPLRHGVGEQRRGLHQEELPGDARAHAAPQRAHHAARRGHAHERPPPAQRLHHGQVAAGLRGLHRRRLPAADRGQALRHRGLRHRTAAELAAHRQPVRVHQPLQVVGLLRPAARQVVPDGAVREARLRGDRDPADGRLPLLGALRAAVPGPGQRPAQRPGRARLLPPGAAAHPPEPAAAVLAAHQPEDPPSPQHRAAGGAGGAAGAGAQRRRPVPSGPEEQRQDAPAESEGTARWKRVRRAAGKERRVRFLLEAAAPDAEPAGPAWPSSNGRPPRAPRPGELQALERHIEAVRERLRQALLRRGDLLAQLRDGARHRPLRLLQGRAAPAGPR